MFALLTHSTPIRDSGALAAHVRLCVKKNNNPGVFTDQLWLYNIIFKIFIMGEFFKIRI